MQSLLEAQYDPQRDPCWTLHDAWTRTYKEYPVHGILAGAMKS